MKARKRFGQHFLEPVWVDKLVAAISPAAGDHFLEIGPGRGALTFALAAAGACVTSVEIDRDLATWLKARVPSAVHVVEGDFLRLPTAAWQEPGQRYRVAANLPYYVSSPILFRLLALARQSLLTDATLMLQREVGARLVATPGSQDYGPLAIMTALQAETAHLMTLPPGAFRPAPRVHSSVVRVRFRDDRLPIGDLQAFGALVRDLFTQRRKTLANALKVHLRADPGGAPPILAAAGIDGSRRPETLTLDELARLAAELQRR